MVGFLVSTGVSLLMNGVCCAYQMNGERELREAMRSDIREEWRLQRALEAQERREYEHRAERLRLEALEKRYHLLKAAQQRHHRSSSYKSKTRTKNSRFSTPRGNGCRYDSTPAKTSRHQFCCSSN